MSLLISFLVLTGAMVLSVPIGILIAAITHKIETKR